QLPAVAEDLEDHGAVGVAFHLRIHANPRGKVRVSAFKVINDFTVGVCPEAVGELAATDLQRLSLYAAVNFQRAPVLMGRHGYHRRQRYAPGRSSTGHAPERKQRRGDPGKYRTPVTATAPT